MIANDCWLFFWFIQFFFSYKWLNLEHNFVTFLMFVIHNVLWCMWKTPDVDDQSLQCHQSRYQHTWLKSIHQDQSRRYYTGSTIFISICTLTLSVLTASKSKWYAALSIIWVMHIIFSPSTRVKNLFAWQTNINFFFFFYFLISFTSCSPVRGLRLHQLRLPQLTCVLTNA